MQNLAPEIASRLVNDVVESPRARKALEKHGVKTLADVVERGIGSLHGLKDVGEATVRLLEKAIGPLPVEADEDDGKVEEGAHPVRLESPYPEFRIALHPSRKVMEPGGGYAIQETLFIEFSGGEASLSKRAWLLREFARDHDRVDAAMKDPAHAWRAKAVDWLKAKGSFARGEFRVLSD